MMNKRGVYVRLEEVLALGWGIVFEVPGTVSSIDGWALSFLASYVS